MIQRRSSRLHARGTTLLETMVALSILLIGLAGLARLQIYGLSSNQGARAYTTAQELARELASGLDQLAFTDSRLTPAGTAGASAPTPYGSMLGVSSFTGVHAMSEGAPPGVRADAELEGGTANPVYVRRWSVWDYAPNGGSAATKFIAVSVVYHERSLARDRETVLYLQKSDAGAVMANAAAYR